MIEQGQAQEQEQCYKEQAFPLVWEGYTMPLAVVPLDRHPLQKRELLRISLN